MYGHVSHFGHVTKILCVNSSLLIVRSLQISNMRSIGLMASEKTMF